MKEFAVGFLVLILISLFSVLGILLFPLLLVLGLVLRMILGIILFILAIWVIGKLTLLLISFFTRKSSEPKI